MSSLRKHCRFLQFFQNRPNWFEPLHPLHIQQQPFTQLPSDKAQSSYETGTCDRVAVDCVASLPEAFQQPLNHEICAQGVHAGEPFPSDLLELARV